MTEPDARTHHFDNLPHDTDPLKSRTRCQHCGAMKPEYRGASLIGFLDSLSRWMNRHVRECPNSPQSRA